MDNDEAGGVATKKRGKASESPGPDRKPMIAQLRGSAKWKAWIEEAAGFDQRSVASFLERAAVRYAKEIGFAKEPPER